MLTALSVRTRQALLVFALLFSSYAAFASGLYNFNALSRIGLTANFVQHGRLDIDEYAKLTLDRAVFNGHYYSDKAPGMSFLAMPIAYAYTRVAPVEAPAGDTAHAPEPDRKLSVMIYLCTLLTSGLITAFAGAALFRYVADETKSAGAGLVAALGYGLATPTWGWATSFFGHAACGAFLVLGFIALERMARETAWTKARIAAASVAGIVLGAAVSVEFTAAIPVTFLMLYHGARLYIRKRALPEIAIELAAIGVVAALMQIPLLVYNNAVFGSPFHVGYSNVVGWDGMKSGIFGINAPNPRVLLEILFGLYRGVLWLSPVLALAAAALYLAFTQPEQRLRAGVFTAIVAFYLAMNAGYAYWDGGASTGPRHITPLFPFLMIALGLWFARADRVWRVAILATLALSMFICFAVAAIDTMAFTTYKAPLFQRILPSFFAGDLSQSMIQIAMHHGGLIQLAPLVLVWFVLGYLLRRELTPPRAAPAIAPAA